MSCFLEIKFRPKTVFEPNRFNIGDSSACFGKYVRRSILQLSQLLKELNISIRTTTVVESANLLQNTLIHSVVNPANIVSNNRMHKHLIIQ